MNPAARRGIRILAIALGLLLVLVAALPYVVSLDSVRARVVQAAQSALHRKVEAGAIRLQIFSGLGAGVEKVVVRNTEGWESPALFTADRVSVKVAFWPLLSRRLEVRRVVLEGATVTVERNPQGALNVDDFLSAGARPSAGAKPATAAALLVSNVELSRASLRFMDRKIAPGEIVTTALDDLAGRISDVGASTAARFDLGARLLADGGRNVSLKGSFGPPPQDKPLGATPLQATLSAKGLALARLGPYLGAKQEADPGVLSLDLTAGGSMLSTVKLAGNFALTPRKDGGSSIPALDGQFVATLDWPHGALLLEKSPISVAKLPLTLQGRVDDLRTAPRVDFTLATPGDVAIDSVTGLPGIAGTLPPNVKLSGRVRLSAELSGPSADLAAHASLEAAPLGVGLDSQPFLTAASTTATLESRGKGPMTGRVTIPAGKLKNLPFEDLVADWSWDRGALTLAPAAKVYGGTLKAAVHSDLVHRETSETRATLELSGVQAQPLVEALTTARNVFAGSLSGKLSLESRGLSWEAITHSAKGDGRVSVADADLRTVALLPEVAHALASIGKVAGFQVPPTLESTKFDRLDTSLHLADGRLATPDLTLSGRDVSVAADGSLGLDRTLAYSGRVVLGPSLVKSLGSAGRYIADAQGRVALPFRANGPISAPKVAIEETVVLDLGRRVLARQAGERVGGAAGKALGDVLEGGSGTSTKANPVDLLQQFLTAPAPTPTTKPR